MSNPVSVMPTGAPLVGRNDDLRRFAEVLQGVIAHRHSAVVLVTGEGGVGKSRFVQEAVAVARGRGVLTLHGTAGPLQRDLSYAPLVEALRPLLRGTGPSGRARIEALVEGLSDLARLFDGLPLVPPQPLNDLGLERTRLFEAVTRLLDRAAAERPVALVLDDLHWADSATLALLHYAVRGLTGRPVLFLLAFREAEADTSLRDLAAALRCGVGITDLPLRPLDSASVDALARGTLGGAVPSGLVEVLTQRTGGVPLFVGAVITRLVEEGTLFRSAGRWVLGPDTAEAVPAAVRSLLGGRIERLPEPARAALDALAVCGGSAPVDVLAAIVDEAAMSTGLDVLSQLGLADQELTGGRVGYRVTHPMLAEVSLELLPAVARRRRHAAAARAWQRAFPEDLGTIALHVCGAGNELEAEYALDVLLRASAEALARRAGEETAAAARAALLAAAALSRDELRGPLLERLAQGEELAGRLAQARAAWRAAAEAGDTGVAGEGGVKRARRLHRAALTGWDLGRFQEALGDLDEADAALAGLPPGPVHVSVLETRARLALRRGDTAAQRRYAAALAAIVEVTGSPRARVVAGMFDLQLAGMERRLRDAMDSVPRVLAQAEALGDPMVSSAAHRLASLTTLVGAMWPPRADTRKAACTWPVRPVCPPWRSCTWWTAATPASWPAAGTRRWTTSPGRSRSRSAPACPAAPPSRSPWRRWSWLSAAASTRPPAGPRKRPTASVRTRPPSSTSSSCWSSRRRRSPSPGASTCGQPSTHAAARSRCSPAYRRCSCWPGRVRRQATGMRRGPR